MQSRRLTIVISSYAYVDIGSMDWLDRILPCHPFAYSVLGHLVHVLAYGASLK
jgi:hypothetical protein